MPPRAARRSGVLALWLLLAALPAAAAGPERGFPLIQTSTPASAAGETQNFGIARDSRGLLYVANIGGVLVYDGAWWRTLEIGRGRNAFAVAADGQGRVAVGGDNELGLLAPDAQGALRFVSLTGLLPPAQRKFDQVMQALPSPGGFLFLTERWLFEWDGRSMATRATFPPGRPFATVFAAGDAVYLWSRDGLARVDRSRITPLPGGEVFRGRRIDTLLPAGHGLLVSVRGEGLFLFDQGKAVPFAPAASRWAAASRLLPRASRLLPDGRWALGSILSGLLLLRPDGTVDQVIDAAVGLPENFVNGLAEDGEGGLWLSLNSGLARVQVGSPLSVIDRRLGLPGSVYALARHQGDLWVGTSEGVFTADPEGGGGPVRLRAVPGLPPSGWSLLSAGGDLLAGTAFGLFRVRHGAAGGAAEVAQVPEIGTLTVYALAPSRTDPQRVWVGTESGLAAIRRERSEWRFAGKAEGVESEVRSIVEGERGVVWCGTRDDGVIGVETAPGPGLLRTRSVRHLGGQDNSNVFRITGRIVSPQDGRVLRLDEAAGSLVADPDLAELRVPAEGLAEDAAGDLWLNASPPAVALRRTDGRTGWSGGVHPLYEVPAHTVEPIVAEPDGVVWLGADNGLYRYAGSFRATPSPLPAPLLSRVTVGDALVFGGAPGVAPPPAELPPGMRRLRIELGPLSYRAGLRYQMRIDPLDADWGRPVPDPLSEVARLPPGEYRFRVRTLGPSGEVGPEAAWAFRVLPPWFERGWALALWGLAAVLLVLGYSRLRSRALRLRAAKLEARVAEQTLELRRTVEELSRAHAELEVANERLEELSLRDELTGVANRRRLQQVLDLEWSRSLRYGRPLAFILLDLDHFKLLNDTRGHQEGDACLQAVARAVDATVRRTSDLVARYGGEEFAVLLPDTDLAGAAQVAEQLRAGIEALALPHPAAPLGHVTASFGVAAHAPAPEDRPERLVNAADRALYRAKTEGRNRVAEG